MKDFIIITDSNCDFPKSYLKEHDLPMLSFSYNLNGHDYVSNTANDLPCKEFYDLLRKGCVSKSSMVSVEAAKNCFSSYLQQGLDILFISFSSALSGTYNSCCVAAKELMAENSDYKILVVDSLSASLGQGLFVNYALAQKKQGKSIDEIYQYLTENRQRFCHYFTVDDLNHLYRGGRVSKMAAFFGTMLGIKPILFVDPEGRLIPIGKVRGRKQSLDALVDKMATKIGTYKNEIVFISHGDSEEDAKYVASKVKERFGITNFLINSVGPVIGSHSGPGTIALFFIGTDREEKKM